MQQVCHCRAGGRVIRQQEHYYIVILFLLALADPGDEPHFGRSVLPAPLMSSYNHQVGSARGRPAYFPRLLGGALELSHGDAAPLLQSGHRVLPRAGLAAGLHGGGAAGPPLHQSLINILVS